MSEHPELTGIYDPDAQGHTLLEVHPADDRPATVAPSADGHPVIVLRRLEPEEYPEGVPVVRPITKVDVYGGQEISCRLRHYLQAVSMELHHASRAVLDAIALQGL